MCGIYGIIHKGSRSINAHMDAMSSITHHRGPDEQNWSIRMESDYLVGLGINRLSIIDVTSGQQPITNQSGQLEIVFNGEIYNYKELRDDLRRRGHVFKTNSDTEVILHAYERWGRACLDKLRGMFAFCIYDGKRKKAFLARDHAGIKPLYYHHRGHTLTYASELKAIKSVVTALDIDPLAVTTYFTYRYVPGPNTIWNGVYGLPPGHYLEYDLRSHQVEIRKWWSPTITPVEDNYRDASRKIINLLEDAVKVRLQSEVPLGSFLSGGIDSSLVSILANKHISHPLNVYNIGYREANEYGYASKVARQYGMDYFQVAMEFDDVVGVMDDVVRHMDQPLSDAACFPTLFLSRIVKRGQTVMLSGEGADELFIGYWQYDGLLQQSVADPAGDKALMAHLQGSSYFLDQGQILADGITRSHNPLSRAFKQWGENGASTLTQRMCHFDTVTWLPDDLLMKVDKMSMAASVEVRVPFLDRALMEYVMGLPDHYKWDKGVTKKILKDIAVTCGVPEEIVHRPKMGFTVPIANLLRGPFEQVFKDVLVTSKFKSLPYFNRKKVTHTVRQFYAGRDDLTLFCWTLFCFAVWIDRHYTA